MTTSMVRDVMTADPITLDSGATAVDAARAMRDSDIGAVIVLDGDTTCGIVTDRDITIRAVADGDDVSTITLGSICSRNATTIGPDASVDEALQIMRREDVRRLPVVDGGQPIGIVSLGDVSVEQDAGDALADISAAPANN
ncbi:MAG TPA: CBS domain-containing protein [Mycobacteriales bacterium]|nr:CBS domain-containing protein [Mycobacteriales bacterium]